jgi:nucleotide-binding universal stress UspA family protein
VRYFVVGIDDAAQTRDLLEWTAEFAIDLDAHVTLVHAVPRAQLWAIAGAMLDSNHHLDQLRAQFERHLVGPLREKGVSVDLRVEVGNPAQVVVEHATRLRADLIVVGSGPRGIVHEIVGGHLSHQIERLSDVPVVVVPRSKASAPVSA